MQYVNPINEGLRTYGMLQSFDANKEARSRDAELLKMRKAEHQAGLSDLNERRAERKEDRELTKNREQDALLLGKMQAAQSSGIDPITILSDDERQRVQKSPLLNPAFIQSPEVGQALETVEKIQSGELDMSALGNPEVAKTLTPLFPELQKGSPGKKEFYRFYPGKEKGTVYIELSVDGKPGAPLTEKRSADDNDRVKEVKVEDLVARAKAAQTMRGMQMSPEGQKYLTELYYQAGGKRPGQTAGAPTELGKYLQEMEQYPEGHPYRKFYQQRIESHLDPGKVGNAPSEQQMHQYLMSVMDLDAESAWAMLRESRGNMAELAAKLAGQRIQARDENPVMKPGREGYMTDEQIYDETVQMLKRFQQDFRGTDKKPGQGSPPPGGGQNTVTNVVIIPDHPVHGDITEADIQTTMREMNMTREQVLKAIENPSTTDDQGVTRGQVIRD